MNNKKRRKKKNGGNRNSIVIILLVACIVTCISAIVVMSVAGKKNDLKVQEIVTSAEKNSEKGEGKKDKPTAEAASKEVEPENAEAQPSEAPTTDGMTSNPPESDEPSTEAEKTTTKPTTTIDETTTIAESTTIPQTTGAAVTDTNQVALAKSGISSVCGNSYTSKETGRKVVDPATENWNLVVVNSSREYVSSYEPKLKEVVPGSGKYLDYRVAPYYTEMYNAAKKDGIILTPYSAYRSYERQANNYANLTSQYMSQYNLSREDAAKKAATVILPPGTSEHNIGLAMDVCNTYDSFAYTKEYAWLTAHAQDYGFILRYTKEKQPITGIVPEPWHWRFVGVENAKKIKASGLCLEEYLDSLGIKY